MTCRSCKEQHKDDALVCPHCHRQTALGYRLKSKRELKSHLLRVGIVLLVILSYPLWLGPFGKFFGQMMTNTLKRSIKLPEPKSKSTSNPGAKATGEPASGASRTESK